MQTLVVLDARASFMSLFQYAVVIKYHWQACVFSGMLTRNNMVTSGKVWSPGMSQKSLEKSSLISEWFNVSHTGYLSYSNDSRIYLGHVKVKSMSKLSVLASSLDALLFLFLLREPKVWVVYTGLKSSSFSRVLIMVVSIDLYCAFGGR